MVDLPYIAGQLNGYSFQAQVAGLGNNMAQPYSSNAYTQPSPTSQLAYSPPIDSRHDSVYSLSPSQPSGYLQHQAESQPDATHLTPHFNNGANAHRSEDMSRETSHTSYQSSVSSRMQYDGMHDAHGYHQNIPPVGTNMQRALSLHSGVATLQNQLFRAQPVQYRSLNEHTHGLPNSYHSDLANMPQNTLRNATMDESVTEFQANDAADARLFGYDINVFGSGQFDNSTDLLPQPMLRPRAKSDAHHSYRLLPYTAISDPQIQEASRRIDPSTPVTTLSSPPIVEQGKRRRRKQTPLSDSESENITGHVLASGKFKCSDSQCEDLRFGRQADFRRHYTNVHADQVIEYFCPITGCERSRAPYKKSKGRSFNGRKDKMQEHVETVHHKLRKRKRSSSVEVGEEDEDTEEAEQPQAKTQRHS